MTAPTATPPLAGSPARPRQWFGLSPLAWAVVLVTAATFFIVEHSLLMSTTSESFESADFVEAEVDTDVEDGNTIRRVGFLAFGAAGFAVLALARRRIDLSHPAVVAAAALVVWTYASLAWSVDAGLTVRRLIVLTLSLLGLAGWTRLLTPRQSVTALLFIAAGYLALGVLCEVGLRTFRPWSGLYRFSGTTHPNTQGILCGMLVVGATVRSLEPTHRGRSLLLAALAFGFLILTKSRTTLAAALIAVSAVLWLRWSWARRAAGVFAAATAGVGLLLGSLVFRPDAAGGVTDTLLMGRTEEATTLTGRLPLWEELIGDFAARPLHGFGYGAFWNPDTLFRVAQNQGWQIPHAHNGYFETTLNLGLIGLLFALAALAAMAWTAFRCDRAVPRLETGWPLGLCVFAAVYSLADAGFALPTFAAFALAATVVQSPTLREETGRFVAERRGWQRAVLSRLASRPTPRSRQTIAAGQPIAK